MNKPEPTLPPQPPQVPVHQPTAAPPPAWQAGPSTTEPPKVPTPDKKGWYDAPMIRDFLEHMEAHVQKQHAEITCKIEGKTDKIYSLSLDAYLRRRGPYPLLAEREVVRGKVLPEEFAIAEQDFEYQRASYLHETLFALRTLHDVFAEALAGIEAKQVTRVIEVEAAKVLAQTAKEA